MKKKRRSESFFGLHFDYHANPETCPAPIGNTLKEEEIREICTTLHPDFIQIDCKGHPGWASYPSKVGNAMPHFKGDPLEVWRRVTEEEGVALYMHYSGVWDGKYCAEHPDEAMLNADGTRDKMATSRFGNYDDNLLIPQLKELAGKYHCDGAWIDGECWGSFIDYDPKCIAAFEKATGIDLKGKPPVNPGDPYYEEFREFNRELFRRHIRHYVDTVHEAYPEFQMASNWAFTDHMPEEVSADVDFLSGDFDPIDSISSSRYAGRAIAQQGMAWDLMSWNFRNEFAGQPGYIEKHPNSILQEAASVISIGGGYQDYIQQFRDGSPKMAEIRGVKPVADFIRKRQPYCQGGKMIHQVAMLMSTYDRHLNATQLYSRNGIEKLKGLTSLICDCGHSLEIVSEHNLYRYGNDIPVIVVPELYAGLEEKTVNYLLDYAKNGGSLVLVGEHTASFFEKYVKTYSVSDVHQYAESFTLDRSYFGALVRARYIEGDGKVVARAMPVAQDMGEPVALEQTYGKGKLIVLSFDIGESYNRCAEYMHRYLMKAILADAYVPMTRLVSVEGTLEITDLSVKGKKMIQLVNMNGNHRSTNIATEDQIPSCRDVVLELNLVKKPEKLILQPEGTELPFEWKNGKARVSIPKIAYHEIIEVVE